MHLISNQQRREALEFLQEYVEMKAGKRSLRELNKQRRAVLLIKKLIYSKEIEFKFAKAMKLYNKNNQDVQA